MKVEKAQVKIFDEIIVDSFAGGGGTSTGIELATGRVVDVAINHDPDAILMHKTNHPYTEHYQAGVWDVDPKEVCRGRKVGLFWASPDCKHFSKAKGGKPVEKKIRGLAWIVLRWAGTVRPRVIILENVEEFQTWGPVRRGHPIKAKTGQTFRRFIDQLEGLDYAVEWRELVQADREGRCGIPPVKLHQHIFRVFNGKVLEETVCQVMWEPFMPGSRWKVWVMGNGLPYYWNDCIGKTVFLTREAAEDALKGEQDG